MSKVSTQLRFSILGIVLIISAKNVSLSHAGIVFADGIRWDAAPQEFEGNERSLQGGLRFSVQGGSYEAYRDRFSWSSLPTVIAFQNSIESAFNAWTVPDPTSGLTTQLSFVANFQTAVVGSGGFQGVNFLGAEIDLFGLDAGDNRLRGFTGIQPVAQTVTLTSGVANYANSGAIAGVDITINNNPGAVYTLDSFRRLLTHEIGHSIGLADVDLGGQFIDDNFDALNPVSTLNNSWAGLVNPLDPANSAGLSQFSIASSTFGLTGINLLMESNGLGVGPGNPLSNLFPLTNDEYGTRQYLYPSLISVPEPGSIVLLSFVLIAAGLQWTARRKPAICFQKIN